MKRKQCVVTWAGVIVAILLAMSLGVCTAVAETLLYVRTTAVASAYPGGLGPSQDLSSSGSIGSVHSSAQAADAIPNASAAATSYGLLGFGHFRGWSTADAAKQELFTVGAGGHSSADGLSNDSILISPANPALAGTQATVVFSVGVSGTVNATNTDVNGLSKVALSCWGFSAWTDTSTTEAELSGCYIANYGYDGDALGVHTLSFDVTLGTQSVLMVNYGTSTETNYLMGDPIGRGHAEALFGSTFLWGGISQVLDASGNPIAFTLTSESGTDWTQPAAVPLYANFAGNGIWQWDGSAWSQLNGLDPTNMVASGSNLYAYFGTSGIWQWNGAAWSQLNGISPTSMVASGSNLYADLGAGIWQWNGSAWSQLNGISPAKMVASGPNLYADLGAGIWQWNGSVWTQLNGLSPQEMVASGTNLYADLGAGIWQWNGSVWTQLNGLSPQEMVASGTNLYADLGAGIWQWNGSVWTQLNGLSPQEMVASGTNLYADLGAGIWQWNGSVWTQLNGLSPTSMVAP